LFAAQREEGLGRTPELSRAERTASSMNFRKGYESEAIKASRSNDLLGCDLTEKIAFTTRMFG
jgi:hypothetical protein